MHNIEDHSILNSVLWLGGVGEGFAIVSYLKSNGSVEKVILRGPDCEVVGHMDRTALAVARGLLSNVDARSPRVKSIVAEGVEDNPGRVVVEIVEPKVGMNVFGAGHVGQAVSILGAMLGYHVTVYDDRQGLLVRARFPNNGIQLSLCNFNDISKNLPIIQNSVNVIVTRGHQYDEECLRAVVGKGAAYIGMIGSKRRVLSIFKRLAETGVEEDLSCDVHAPVGLKIGAVTPQEIAISIMAEVIQILNQGRRSLLTWY